MPEYGGFLYPPGSGVAPAQPRGWQSIYEVDFSALPAQTLSADGNYTVDGKVWKKLNTGNEYANCTLNAPGLPGFYFYPKQNPTIGPAQFDCPAIWLDLLEILDDYDLSLGIRISAWNNYNNCAANFDRAVIALGTQTYTLADESLMIKSDRGWCGTGEKGFEDACFIYGQNASGYLFKSGAATYYNNFEEIILETQAINSGHFTRYRDVGAYPYTTLFTTARLGTAWRGELSGSSYSATPRKNLGIILGAFRAGSGTAAFAGAFRALKVEVLRP